MWTSLISASVVCRPTQKEAADYAHYYIHEKGDRVAIDNVVKQLGIRQSTMPPKILERLRYRMGAGWGGLPLIGTPEQIVDMLLQISNIGLDGLVLSCVQYQDELRQWVSDVMPLMEQAGLRKPFVA